VRIGTRASPLALAQARHVAALLGPDTEIVEITTTGDRDRAAPDKEKWVKELELALRDGRVDLCVHSAKDVPTSLPAGLALVGVPAREDARDALCGAASVDALPPGARVGTSSLRRAALLQAARPDLEIVEIRGNVGTRLAKLADAEVDALVLALAGLRRLGLQDAVGSVLDAGTFVPAAGQGALALECRADDEAARRALSALTVAHAAATLTAERAVVRDLGADCHSAVGAHATGGHDGVPLALTAWVGSPDGAAWVRDAQVAAAGESPAALGVRVAQRLLATGAGELLATGAALDPRGAS